MPKSDACDITMVLDRSGSMSAVAGDTIGGVNTFVADQQKVPGDCRFTLVQFDDVYEFVHRGVPIADVPPLTSATFVPRGYTALLDAVGRAIAETGARLGAMPEAERPGRVFFAIVTDGHENASREYTHAKVLEMINHQRDAYSWQFVFLGANQDAIKAGTAIGVPAANAMTYAHNSEGTARAFGAMSRGTTANRVAAAGAGVEYFSQDDRDQQVKAGAAADGATGTP
jgi:hypothetical protein